MKQRPRVQNKKQKPKGKGNFSKIAFQKMPLDSMIGPKAKKKLNQGGMLTKRGQ